VRQLGEELRAHKEPLGQLVSLEMGKILTEGLGEVQEMIDICDFAVGLSRQLYGLTMHSERPFHRMYEQWHPLGVVGIVTAFNFPVAVWSWNAAIAAVCGDTMIWKPSHKTPLTAVAVQHICDRLMERNGLTGVFNLCMGTHGVAERMVADRRIPLISATGSTRMGKTVGRVVAERFGRSLLELGGNNAIVVMDDADLDLVVRAVLFGAVGTAGQRCTSTRRLILQRGIAGPFVERLKAAYAHVRIGDPLDGATLMGPLVDEDALTSMMDALARAKAEGAQVLCGGKRVDRAGYFVEPTLVLVRPGMEVPLEETFAPVLWIYEVDTLEEALVLHNGVPQGLSSSIFTRSVLSAERLRHRQREHRDLGRGDRGRLRGREGDGGRSRVRLRFLEALHAPSDEHHQLGNRPAARPGRQVRRLTLPLDAFGAPIRSRMTESRSTGSGRGSPASSVRATSFFCLSFFCTSARMAVSRGSSSRSLGSAAPFPVVTAFCAALAVVAGIVLGRAGRPTSFGERTSSGKRRVSARRMPFSARMATTCSRSRRTNVAIPTRSDSSMAAARSL